jgi:hypothetical protein
MATVVGGGPVGVVGEQGQSLGFASFFAVHGNTKATATANALNLGAADAAGNITHIVRLSSLTRSVTIGGTMVASGTSSVTTNPAVYVYGLTPLTSDPADAARVALNAGTIPTGTAACTVRRLDAAMGDPATIIDHTLAKCHTQSPFLWTPIPTALDRMDTQACEYLVVLVGTALASDTSTAQLYGMANA